VVAGVGDRGRHRHNSDRDRSHPTAVGSPTDGRRGRHPPNGPLRHAIVTGTNSPAIPGTVTVEKSRFTNNQPLDRTKIETYAEATTAESEPIAAGPPVDSGDQG